MKRCIAVLVLAGVLAAPAASAQTKTHKRPPRAAAGEQAPLTEQEAGDQLRKRLQEILNAWSLLDADAAAKYYAKDADLVFFEPNALQYKGWDAYYLGMKKLFGNYQNLSIRLNDDASVHFKGDLAYATATWNVEGTRADTNAKEQIDLRWTVVLERRNGEWVVVHEHVSAPTMVPPPKPPAPPQPEKPKDPFK